MLRSTSSSGTKRFDAGHWAERIFVSALFACPAGAPRNEQGINDLSTIPKRLDSLGKTALYPSHSRIPQVLLFEFLELSRCIWESLKIYYQYCMPGKNSVPGAVIAIQTFGDFLGFNPHGHVLVTDGCFPELGLFKVAPAVRLKYLEKIFRSKVFTLLLAKGKITPDLINLLKSWKHSGFQVFCGPRIHPREKASMENLARYIIRASFSQERMTYLPEESWIIYRSKDNRQEKIFDALDWLAAMCSHIPDQREQMVRYYGFYSNVSRGLRQKENEDALYSLTIYGNTLCAASSSGEADCSLFCNY